jgi:hypothetical protein
MVLAGYTQLLLFAFAAIAMGWLLVTVTVLARAKKGAVAYHRASGGLPTTRPSSRRPEPMLER